MLDFPQHSRDIILARLERDGAARVTEDAEPGAVLGTNQYSGGCNNITPKYRGTHTSYLAGRIKRVVELSR